MTAVIVDDELSVLDSPKVHGGLRRPGQFSMEETGDPEDSPAHRPHPLDVDPVAWSFAREGMVCGVISSSVSQENERDLAKAVARADIVILDWRLNRQTGATALPLLRRVVAEDQGGRLRLIAFYTGEPERERIRDRIEQCLEGLGSPDRMVSRSAHDRNVIEFGACRIVVYGKPVGFGARKLTDLLPEDEVQEEALASKLVDDFAQLVEGLLPSLVLTSLTAVRENIYTVLQSFHSRLDPAFLAHRACLPLPSDSERHIVEQIGSELFGIMDDAVADSNPAGIDAIERWLTDKFGDEDVVFPPTGNTGPDRRASQSQVLEMLVHGMEKKWEPLRKGGKEFQKLSHGFSGGADDSTERDRHLASAMSFRQVSAKGPPQLSMGTVVRQVGSENNSVLLCAMPKCDSVRLPGRSSFLFLPLCEPPDGTPQLVVPSIKGGHDHMAIVMNPSGWRTLDFDPKNPLRGVFATQHEQDNCFVFEDASQNRYRWVGELKAEFAQYVAQAVASRMSRVGLNKSEWLRRSER